MGLSADGKYPFHFFFYITFWWCSFLGQEVKPSRPFAKWKASSAPKAGLILERWQCFALAFLITVKGSDISLREGFSLGFFPD